MTNHLCIISKKQCLCSCDQVEWIFTNQLLQLRPLFKGLINLLAKYLQNLYIAAQGVHQKSHYGIEVKVLDQEQSAPNTNLLSVMEVY